MALAQPGGRKSEPINKRVVRLLRSVAMLFGAGGIVAIGMEAIGWFRDGVWTSQTLLDLWLWLGNSYSLRASSGTDRFVLQLLDLPLGVTLLVVALAILIVARRIEGPPS